MVGYHIKSSKGDYFYIEIFRPRLIKLDAILEKLGVSEFRPVPKSEFNLSDRDTTNVYDKNGQDIIAIITHKKY